MTKILKSSTFLFVLLIFALPACSRADEEEAYLPREQIVIHTASGQDLLFGAEMALQPWQQERGLMNRTSLPEDGGMLFVFGGERPVSFWMHDTLIPLDMLFVSKDGTITHIHHRAKPLDDSRITSPYPAKAVLEIKGGLAEQFGIREGDKIIHPVFRNDLAQ
ncbi:MAG: DUF192 domain-containing protein [Alphaproteobacteria bacterium]|nr:DUF192 domain-containing protein [Alphaproteobacteria bacterium]